MLEQSADMLGVKPEMLNSFEAIDTFNNNNILLGYICRQSDYRYGAMVITHVNDVKCSQIVYGTPKMKYPFDKNGVYNFPEMIHAIAYEKLDGTNIVAYHYNDDNDMDCVTYKLRLSPIVRANSYGDFYSMWCEVLDNNHWIKQVIVENPDCNLSFELYGSRNPITIEYDIPLDAMLLFKIHSQPYGIEPMPIGNSHIKTPRVYHFSRDNMVESYNTLRQQLTDANTESGKLSHEGIVLYGFLEDRTWKQFKLKPEEIERIHWSSSSIPRNALWNTALNTFESHDDPSRDDFIELLKEEYTDEQIGKASPKIAQTWTRAYDHIKLVALVNDAWKKARDNGFDVTADKNGTMRFLSQYFDKKQMRKVGSIVLKQAGLI